MNFYSKLQKSWKQSNSLVCVGLDPLLDKLPLHLKGHKKPLFEFIKSIVNLTAEHVCAFKPQIAYFSSQGAETALEETIAYIHEAFPHIPVILDAKRSDIAMTSEQYAIEAFDRYKADALTVVPFQGTDSMRPYLDRIDKGVILLCRTSNPSSADLQDLEVDGEPLYRIIAKKAVNEWNTNGNVSLVVGATQPNHLQEIRRLVGHMPILVPGIGPQGGQLESTVLAGMDSLGAGLIVSSSRAVLYASSEEDFAERALEVVLKIKNELNFHRQSFLKS
ncbi:MAG: orotidine-5'-phosphate decarboxylase [Bdellovibrionales bacterium]|nr:orotidine-5'-phosphate decarboxylase [Bdellovibrionales bacterium]